VSVYRIRMGAINAITTEQMTDAKDTAPTIVFAAPVAPGCAPVSMGVVKIGFASVLLTTTGIALGTSVRRGSTVCNDVIDAVRVKFFRYEAIAGYNEYDDAGTDCDTTHVRHSATSFTSGWM